MFASGQEVTSEHDWALALTSAEMELFTVAGNVYRLMMM